MSNENRNKCMDTIKGFACIAVVLIHYSWNNNFGMAVKAVCRFAVPFFFFVSGYFLPDRGLHITREDVKRKIKHILHLLVISGAAYLVFCIIWQLWRDPQWDIVAFCSEKVTIPLLIKAVINNDPLVYDHFWYMLALVYCYITMYCVQDRLPNWSYLILALFFMLGYSVLEEFKILYPYVTNWHHILNTETFFTISNIYLFRAMPFFLMGIYLRKKNAADSRKWNAKVLGVLFLSGSACAVIEIFATASIQFYLGTYLAVFALMIYSVQYPAWNIKPIYYLGSQLSLYVYIYHFMIGKTIDLFATKHNLWQVKWFVLIRPLLVLAASIFFAWAIVKLRHVCQSFKSRKRGEG